MVKLLDNETFLNELSKLFKSRTDHGSIYLTQKRCLPFPSPQLTIDSYKANTPAKPSGDDFSDIKTSETFPILVRATDGDKFKVSTIVSQDGIKDFFEKYGEVCKLEMQGLKKRDRKKEKAKKEKKKEKKEVK